MTSQAARDAKLKRLIDAMVDACSFVEPVEPLVKLSKHQSDTINRILQQVIQCTYFIKAYCKNDSFGEAVLLSCNHLSSELAPYL